MHTIYIHICITYIYNIHLLTHESEYTCTVPVPSRTLVQYLYRYRRPLRSLLNSTRTVPSAGRARSALRYRLAAVPRYRTGTLVRELYGRASALFIEQSIKGSIKSRVSRIGSIL